MQQAEQKVKKCFSEEAAAAGIGAYYVCPASLRVYRKLWQYVHKYKTDGTSVPSALCVLSVICA